MNLQSQCRGDKAEHRWKMLVHADGCHFYQSSYRCIDCGAYYSIWLERDMSFDPWSAVWMEPIGAESEDCERCQELLGGAPVAEPIETFALR